MALCGKTTLQKFKFCDRNYGRICCIAVYCKCFLFIFCLSNFKKQNLEAEAIKQMLRGMLLKV